MTSVFKYIYVTSTTFLSSIANMVGTAETSETLERSWTPVTAYESSRYSPSVSDVLEVKAILSKNFDLPIELIDSIIDTAEYWPHTSTVTNHATMIRAQRDRENEFILRSYPLGFEPTESQNQDLQMLPEYKSSYSRMEPQPWPESRQVPSDATEEVFKKWESASQPRGEHPCRKVVFTIRSRDQGWGGGAGRGTYDGSYTWFDAGLEKISAFRENTSTDARKVAPLPQFRLKNMDGHKQGSTPKNLNSPMHSLVCSLRTILPPTVDNNKMAGTQHDYAPPPQSDKPADPPTNPTPPPANPPNNYAEDASADPEHTNEGEVGPRYVFEHPLNPTGSALQKNKTATRPAEEHIITWSYDDRIRPDSKEAQDLEEIGRGRETGTGEIVRSLKTGDVVTVWAKARYGGWVNHVEEVRIDAYWAV